MTDHKKMTLEEFSLRETRSPLIWHRKGESVFGPTELLAASGCDSIADERDLWQLKGEVRGDVWCWDQECVDGANTNDILEVQVWHDLEHYRDLLNEQKQYN